MKNTLKNVSLRFVALASVNVLLVLSVSVTSVSAKTTLISKGGILYPHTGDSTQTIYRLPKEARDILRPGLLLGVLPANCSSASGPEGDYYICHYGIYLKPYFQGERLAYLVLKIE
jgi:hypothetical protein